MMRLRRLVPLSLQYGLVVILVVTIVINITFLVETRTRLNALNTLPSEYVEQFNKPGDGIIPNPSEKTSAVQVVSSKQVVSVIIDGHVVYKEESETEARGIHLIVLHQTTMRVMAQKVFDTYLDHVDGTLVEFVNRVSRGRILIFSIKDEGTFHLKANARKLLADMGSEQSAVLNWRDMWAFIAVKGGGKIAEGFAKTPSLMNWGETVTVHALIVHQSPPADCVWYTRKDEVSTRRRDFCDMYEGYGSVCSCDEPSPIIFLPPMANYENMKNVPVAIIASNRPQYLYECLTTLLSIPGAHVSMVTVYIDGSHEEAMAVARLLGVQAFFHTPSGVKNARISQHYKSSLTATFTLYPKAEYMLIVEEDLRVSPDFFNYFNQILPLMNKDPSIYCVSAWNDLGYVHSCNDPSQLYRVETMPGLGWLLKKSMYKQELEPNWPSPDKQWDWDMWMRNREIRKGRECIIPDMSRTYHFGKSGLNVNPYFQEVYFKKHAFMTLPRIKLKNVNSLQKENYDVLLQDLLKKAVTLDHGKSPCNDSFIPDTTDQIYVMYIRMTVETDYTAWMQIAKCFHIWDLDARGFHQGVWRLFLKTNHILVVGVPYSPYSVYKDVNIDPIKPTKPTEKPAKT